MIAEILKKYPFIVLDGAFSTELEKQGFAINDELWSAIALYKNPELVEAVHLSYYEAGADIVTSASYQATVDGFEKKGFSKEEAASLIQSSIALVQDARDEYLSSHEEENRPAPLTAASVGPYGAYLADGSEYRGDYGKTREELADFHRERIHILAEAGPDVFACETIPCLVEALAETDVLSKIPGAEAWISFSCKDGLHTCGGDLISDCAKALKDIKEVAAIGINCTAPQYVESLIKEIVKVTDKPVVVYPNSGEDYDAGSKSWEGSAAKYEDYVKIWYEAGARLIGGCCRTGPEDIRKVAAFRKSLIEK
ncbi:homocysteine S-methyltransferase [Dialister hominis]|uniref:homocysteine S-methyltransferase n=1 Tax=Dialister hominis TaxID=2582419 RepID=UPI003FD7F973